MWNVGHPRTNFQIVHVQHGTLAVVLLTCVCCCHCFLLFFFVFTKLFSGWYPSDPTPIKNLQASNFHWIDFSVTCYCSLSGNTLLFTCIWDSSFTASSERHCRISTEPASKSSSFNSAWSQKSSFPKWKQASHLDGEGRKTLVGVRLAFFSFYKIDIWKLLVNQLVFGKEKSRKANKFLMLTEKRGRLWENRRTYQMKASEAFGKSTFVR